MSSVVISGDTSGSITLQAPAVAGSNTLTLPASTGTIITTASSGQSIPKAALPTGSVLQVVSNSVTSSSYASTTSTSFVTTGHSCSITPSSTTSKILILVSAYCGYNYVSNASYGGFFTVYRNSTNLSGGANNGLAALSWSNLSGPSDTNLGISYIDSPSTTSSTTYTVYFFSNNSGGTLTYCCSFGSNLVNSVATITLMEIAG
jgi:hypothetical protein